MKKVFDEQAIATHLLNYATLCGELQMKSISENKNDPKLLQAAMAAADHEAMIRTLAAMFEENNQALLEHFELLGILPKE